MLSVLIRKQLLQISSFILINKKTGKKRSAISLILFGLLIVYVFFALAMLFYLIANSLCKPLCDMGLNTNYFAIMATMATTVGIFGSVFSTYSSLYQAKDNEMLLSMPVKPRGILFSRMLGCYLMSFIFEAAVLLPTELEYIVKGFASSSAIVIGVIALFILPLFSLTISCILGWLVALIATKIKNKSLVTTAFSLAFLIAYYYFYSQLNHYLQILLNNSEEISNKIKVFLYPIYQLAVGMCGKIIPFVIFSIIVIGFFALIYLILSLSFIKLIITKRGSVKTKYKTEMIKDSSIGQTLLKREFLHFKNSSIYMLNCSLGTLFLIAIAVLTVVKSSDVQGFITNMGINSDFIFLIACGAVLMMTSMNDLTAPSVSLEGKTIWIVQTLPISGWQALKGKIKLHLYMTVIPALICSVAVAFVFKFDLVNSILLILLCQIYIIFSALFGLWVNIKAPRLDWENEAIVVKQSMSVGIALFGGWVLIIMLGAIYYFLSAYLDSSIFIAVCLILFLVLSIMLYKWLKTKGSLIFEKL